MAGFAMFSRLPVLSGWIFIEGDPNMALYRYSSTRQESMDIQGGMYQGLSTPMVGGYLPGLSSSVLTYFLDAWAQSPRCMPFCIPNAQHVSANSLLLKQYEDALGQPYRDCPKIDWSTFPGLDPMVATVWSGAIRLQMINGQFSPRIRRSSS